MRLRSDVRISVRIGGGHTRRIELYRQPAGRKFWVRLDGRLSKVSENTVTGVTTLIRKWIVEKT